MCSTARERPGCRPARAGAHRADVVHAGCLQSVELRRRVQAGLNKGEARNALARAVFFNRLGEIRDRGFEQQRYRASGLNLVTAAVVRWNTVDLKRAAQALHGNGHAVDETLCRTCQRWAGSTST